MLESLKKVDESYPGGLAGYISNARELLAEAREGNNPFEGFVPHQPDIVDLTNFDTAYDHYEALGQKQFSKMGVVLVAGGLGDETRALLSSSSTCTEASAAAMLTTCDNPAPDADRDGLLSGIHMR